MPYNLVAGKNVKDDAEANQIVAKHTKEEGKERINYVLSTHSSNGTPMDVGKLEGIKARTLNQQWLQSHKVKVDREEGEKIYIQGADDSRERLRLYDPKKISPVKDPNTGLYNVDP